MRPENRDRVRGRWAAALAAAALGSILLITGCQVVRPASPGLSSEPVPPPGSSVTSSEYSTLNAAGVQQIESSRQARLDRTDGDFLKSAVRVADFSQVTCFLTADSRDEYFALIRDGVEQYGIESRAAEGWIASISGRPADQSSFALGPGATGWNVSYDLRYDGPRDVQVIIVHVSPVQ